jgi:hypothetical protein
VDLPQHHGRAAGAGRLAGHLPAGRQQLPQRGAAAVLLRLPDAPQQVRSLLSAYRSALQAQQEEFTAIIDKLGTVSTPAARAGRLTALHGLRTAEGRLQWVGEAETQLGEDHPR